MRDVDITPADARDATRFDAVMREAFAEESNVHLADGVYKTAGLPEWNRTRPDRGFLLNGRITVAGEATIVLDPSAILDSDIDDVPQRIITGRGVYDYAPDFASMTPQQVADALPKGQTVIGNLKLVGNHSALVKGWQKAGKSLRTSAILLQGHNARIDGVVMSDFGAWRSASTPDVGAETFPAAITGAAGGPDRDKIAQLDDYKFDATGDASIIARSSFVDYVPEASNDQVTVFMITGSIGQPNGSYWRFSWRKNAHLLANKVIATGKNLVQGFTIYLAESGGCRFNESDGADILYYADFLQTRNVTIDSNTGKRCRHGVNLLLSPAGPGCTMFFHDGYTIGPNTIDSSDANVSLNTLAVEWQKLYGSPPPATRYMRNISVDASLSLETSDDVRYKIINAPSKGGCLRKFF